MVRARTRLEEALDDPTLAQILQLIPDAQDSDVVEALLQDKAMRDSLKEQGVSERVPLWLRSWSRIKALVMIGVLYFITMPLSLVGIALSLAVEWLTQNPSTKMAIPPNSRGTVLVSGGNKGKCLAVVRHLHRAGWRVVLCEVQTGWGCAARFSNCVSAFYSTPRPNTDPLNYFKAIQRIAKEEQINMFFPVSMAQYSVYESLAASLLPPNTICCTTDPHWTALLNDKVAFTKYARSKGLAVPEMFHVTSKDQLLEYNNNKGLFKGKRFLLKSVAYDAISRQDLFTLPCDSQKLAKYIRQFEISVDKPWLLQQFLKGPEYSSYTVADKGKMVAHCDNEASLSCLQYQHFGIPEIYNWVKDFCTTSGASGQLCFDYMYDEPGGNLYCIEANPRTSTNLMAFYNHPGFAHAYFEPQQVLKANRGPLLPLKSGLKSYWIWNELGESVLGPLLSVKRIPEIPRRLVKLVETVLNGVDAVFDAEDPLPFLALHYLQEPLALYRVVLNGTPWVKLDLCSGKVVELGGD